MHEPLPRKGTVRIPVKTHDRNGERGASGRFEVLDIIEILKVPSFGRTEGLKRIVVRRSRDNFVRTGGISGIGESGEGLGECLHLGESEGAVDGSSFFEKGFSHYYSITISLPQPLD